MHLHLVGLLVWIQWLVGPWPWNLHQQAAREMKEAHRRALIGGEAPRACLARHVPFKSAVKSAAAPCRASCSSPALHDLDTDEPDPAEGSGGVEDRRARQGSGGRARPAREPLRCWSNRGQLPEDVPKGRGFFRIRQLGPWRVALCPTIRID